MTEVNNAIKRLDNKEYSLVNGGSIDGLGPNLPPQRPDNGIDPFILDQLRRIRMYGGV